MQKVTRTNLNELILSAAEFGAGLEFKPFTHITSS